MRDVHHVQHDATKCMTLYYIRSYTPLRATADAHLELDSIKNYGEKLEHSLGDFPVFRDAKRRKTNYIF